MSGCSYTSLCPNCRNSVDEYSDHKPFAVTIIGPCLECGFYTEVVVRYLTLDQINEAREGHNELYELEGEDRLEPLVQLPEQEEF